MEKFRELIWPLLERAEVQNAIPLTVEEITINDDNISKVLDYAMKIYESELSRNSAIETKASLFISSLAIITSVVLAITTTLIGQNGFSSILFLLICMLFFLTIYVLRTVWFAVKVHERKPFSTFYHNDILKDGDEKEFSIQLILSIINKTKKNSIVINSKIDNMVMAQEYFKRAIITLSIYSFLLIFFFIDKCKFGIKTSVFRIVKIFNEISLSTWLVALLILIAISSVIINFILIKRLDKKSTETV
ncbi:hypothetical protein [Flavobacterium sp. ABG]|uniref:hypothetical protein n=1 Tax=Flavobacterium sp. ABG TaxID=1423322 RepID=UPI0006495179|nr:hypothetical protein [Flavobacterium sp. ABG]KLT67767.1 hypothetical protein AB674_20985 [Flavobacterium sp. ABG]